MCNHIALYICSFTNHENEKNTVFIIIFQISQVLGHNEHLYVRLPKGFWTTHVVIGVGVTIEALLLLVTPKFAGSLGVFPPPVIDEGDSTHSSVALRLAGAALAGKVD